MGTYGMCGDDPKTTGHVDLIQQADLLATAVLNGNVADAMYHAQCYRNTRFLAQAEARENANAPTVYDGRHSRDTQTMQRDQ